MHTILKQTQHGGHHGGVCSPLPQRIYNMRWGTVNSSHREIFWLLIVWAKNKSKTSQKPTLPFVTLLIRLQVLMVIQYVDFAEGDIYHFKWNSFMCMRWYFPRIGKEDRLKLSESLTTALHCLHPTQQANDCWRESREVDARYQDDC